MISMTSSSLVTHGWSTFATSRYSILSLPYISVSTVSSTVCSGSRWSLTLPMQYEIGCQEAEGPWEAQELKQVVHEQVVSSQSVQHCSKFNTSCIYCIHTQILLIQRSSAETCLTAALPLVFSSRHALSGLLEPTADTGSVLQVLGNCLIYDQESHEFIFPIMHCRLASDLATVIGKKTNVQYNKYRNHLAVCVRV